MNLESVRKYCNSLKGVEEDMPFDDVTLVFKVMGKIFLLTDTEGELNLNMKCDPETAIELRASYPAVQPGYHMNKTHWNTVYSDGSIDDELIYDWIKHSYDLVISKLPSKLKDELKELD